MKNINIILITLLAVMSGCSYKAQLSTEETNLNFTITENSGFLVSVAATPDDDRVYYLYSVYKASVLDSLVSLYNNETEAMQDVIDSTKTLYEEYKDYYTHSLKHSYMAEFEDLMLYYSKSELTFPNLIPETEYVAFGFCVDPISLKPIGRLQKLYFETTAIPEDAREMTFEFMLQDTKDHFYYYIKPTYEGLVCNDLYYADIVSDRDLKENYDNDLGTYINSMFELFNDIDMLDLLLSQDITRREDVMIKYDYLEEGEGLGYTVFAVPYNPKYKSEVYCYHFHYKPGMFVDYTYSIANIQ